MVVTALLSMLSALHSGFFTILFFVVSTFLLILVVRKLFDYVLTRELDRSGEFALITGCDTGFGNIGAYELNKRQIHVFAACLTNDAVQTFNDDENFKGTAFIMDVTRDDDVTKAKALIEATVGNKGLCCLYNNAGISGIGPIEWLTVEDLKRTSEVNLWGAVRVTKAMLPLVQRARGRIVNTTSVAGRAAGALMAAYHISKYAFEAFSDSLRYEMKPWGVSVHIIEPGFMRTPLVARAKQEWGDLWDRQTDEIKTAYGEGFVKQILKNISDVEHIIGDPRQVVKAYLHAGLSTRPSLRYIVGADAWLLAATVGTLPTFLGDMVGKLLNAPQPQGKVT